MLHVLIGCYLFFYIYEEVETLERWINTCYKRGPLNVQHLMFFTNIQVSIQCLQSNASDIDFVTNEELNKKQKKQGKKTSNY